MTHITITPEDDYLMVRRHPDGGYVAMYGIGDLPMRRIRPTSPRNSWPDIDKALCNIDIVATLGSHIHPECTLDPNDYDTDAERLSLAFDISDFFTLLQRSPQDPSAAALELLGCCNDITVLRLAEVLTDSTCYSDRDLVLRTAAQLHAAGVRVEDLGQLVGFGWEIPQEEQVDFDEIVTRILGGGFDGQAVSVMAVLHSDNPSGFSWAELAHAALTV